MVINAALGGYLLRVGKRRRSISLTANGKHVLTDSWTSVGVAVGLGLTQLTGWLPWDPFAALIVAANILVTGFKLLRRSIGGLMDAADPSVHQRIVDLLENQTKKHRIIFHSLRHRHLGDGYWVEVHLLFPKTTGVPPFW